MFGEYILKNYSSIGLEESGNRPIHKQVSSQTLREIGPHKMLQIAFQVERKSKLNNEVAIGGLEPSIFFNEGAAE